MRMFLCEKPSRGRDIAKVVGTSRRNEGYLAGSGVPPILALLFFPFREQTPISPQDILIMIMAYNLYI